MAKRNFTPINKLEQIDLQSLAAEDIRWLTATGVSISHGSGPGKTYTYRSGVLTPIGDIELSVWISAAEHLIRRDGLEEEVEHLRIHLKKQHPDNVFQTRTDYAQLLDVCLCGLHRDPKWVGFVDYNRQYHPDVLEKTPMARVFMECCKKVAEIPEVQVKSARSGMVSCPFCTRFEAFQNVQAADPDSPFTGKPDAPECETT